MRTNTRKKPLMSTGILITALALLLVPGLGMATPEVDDDDDERNEWDEWMVPTAPGAGHEPHHVTAASAAQDGGCDETGGHRHDERRSK